MDSIGEIGKMLERIDHVGMNWQRDLLAGTFDTETFEHSSYLRSVKHPRHLSSMLFQSKRILQTCSKYEGGSPACRTCHVKDYCTCFFFAGEKKLV